MPRTAALPAVAPDESPTVTPERLARWHELFGRALSLPACPAVLTVAQVSAVLNIPEKTLERWRVEGAGPGYLKVGAAVRYGVDDLAAWLDAQSRGAGHERN
ncbi:hypothetical protein D9M68_320980 [compost metagenome]